ncbi:MAG: MBL fold metallo-hydrolase [Bacteroidetes bacterium]|nr:MAG: MBL fold metallo-hydrolase [Bacteroidota bacterium]
MKLTPVHTGFLKLDGGAMFGVVPKRMWERLNPPDANNMCTWALRTLLVETGDRKILIDTGIGNKQDDRFRSHFEPHGEQSLFGSLADAGVSREAITDVFLTHLHFDHCGGALWLDEKTGIVEPAFPNATYWSNEPHFRWASAPNAREKASFLAENFQPLLEMGKMKFVDVRQDIEFAPGFRVRFFYGHTEAMMVPVLDTGSHTVWYCADVLPSQWHIGMPYVMAYDVRPLVTLDEKAAILQQVLEEKHLLFFEHDPVIEAGMLTTDSKGRIVLGESGNLADLQK